MQQHRTQDNPDRQHQRQALRTQRRCADNHNIGVIPEQLDQLRCESEGQHRQRRHRATAQADAEVERLPHAGAFACAVVCAAHWLEALPKADKRRVCEHRDTVHNAHRSNGGIRRRTAVIACGQIQQHGGNAAHALAAERRHTAGEYLIKVMWLRGKTAQPYLDCRAAAVEYQQYHKADELTDGRCPGSPGHAHFQPENQHRVKHNVEHRAGHDADH